MFGEDRVVESKSEMIRKDLVKLSLDYGITTERVAKAIKINVHHVYNLRNGKPTLGATGIDKVYTKIKESYGSMLSNN